MVLIILFLLLVGILAKVFIFKGNTETSVEVVLETYFDAKKKSGDFIYIKEEKSEEGRFWVDNRKFVIEFDQENGYHRWLISPDGENVYYCYEESEKCVVGVTPIDNYLLRWFKPSENMENLGIDEEYDCEKIMYTVDELYNIEGASNAWYVDYLMYCVDNGELVYREHSGHSVSENDEAEGESTISRFYLEDVDLSPNLNKVSFDTMYEIEID